MELDCYFPDGMRLSEAAAAARCVQDAGFAAMWVTETRHNPFLTCGVGLAAAERIRAGSGIAVAFPGSPMVAAQLARDGRAAQFGAGVDRDTAAELGATSSTRRRLSRSRDMRHRPSPPRRYSS
jgi:Luciferase-like monooxygenase